MKNNYRNLITLSLLGLSTLALPVFAAMTGLDYRIDSDSINSGGTDNSLSAEYSLDDTIGEMATGESGSSDYNLSAGYRQMEESSVTIVVSATNLALSPALGGLSGGTSAGSVGVSVITDNTAGYLLSITAEDSPAMQSSDDSFADYTPAGAVPDYTLIVPSGGSIFAFSPKGGDVIDRFRDDSSVCGSAGGNSTSDRCWDGLSTTSANIANGSGNNIPGGVMTTIQFTAGIGANYIQKMGNYTATTTVTAVAI